MKSLSIIIPLYNKAKTICALLNSIAVQSIADSIEIIVVDDASEDNGIDIVRQWSATFCFPVIQIVNKEHEGALRTRLLGYAASSAPYIMFADADDTLLGHQRLQRVLARAQKGEIDITHCRTVGLSPDGQTPMGELSWAAPYIGILENTSIFLTFFSNRTYPPLLIWSKIFSRKIMDIVAARAQSVRIFRFDDKFLLTVAVFYATSYIGCDEVLYEYRTSDIWPIEKYAGRVRDLYTLLDFMLPLLHQQGNAEASEVFLQYIQRRIAINMGRLSLSVEGELKAGAVNAQSLFARTVPYLDEAMLTQASLLSCAYNANIILQSRQALHNAHVPSAYAFHNLPEPADIAPLFIKMMECWTQREGLEDLLSKPDVDIKLLNTCYQHIHNTFLYHAEQFCFSINREFFSSLCLSDSMWKQLKDSFSCEAIVMALLICNADSVHKLQHVTHTIIA